MPPSSLLTPCERPMAERMETNEDLIRFSSQAVLMLEKCAAKVEAIRVFYEIEDQKENLDDLR